MHEQTLKNFFLGDASSGDLVNDVKDAVTQPSPETLHQEIIDMNDDFEITIEHLALLCEMVIEGSLEATDLESVGYCLAASDHFYWDQDTQDGKIIADVVHMWATPENNYPLTYENAMKYREYLMTGFYPFEE